MESVDLRFVRQVAVVSELLFQSKWRVQILCALRSGPVRLGQLVRLIPGASKKMLTENLRKLEAGGVVVRMDLSDLVLHVEYYLEPEMRQAVCALLDHMAQCGNTYGP
jgi:DNA-binding HxlR family transcriptional regulator